MEYFLPMKIYSPVFYMTPYSLGHGYLGFEGTCCRNVQGR